MLGLSFPGPRHNGSFQRLAPVVEVEMGRKLSLFFWASGRGTDMLQDLKAEKTVLLEPVNGWSFSMKLSSTIIFSEGQLHKIGVEEEAQKGSCFGCVEGIIHVFQRTENENRIYNS